MSGTASVERPPAVVKPGFVIRHLDQGRPYNEAAIRSCTTTGDQTANQQILVDFLTNRWASAQNVIALKETAGAVGCEYVTIEGGVDFPAHHHTSRDALVFVIKGSGTIVANGEPYAIEPGVCIFIGRNTVHEIRTDGRLEYIAIIHADTGPVDHFDFVF